MGDKSLFLASLTDEERAQVKAVIDRLVNETEGTWTGTEYVQYGIIAWFLERWDTEMKGVALGSIDPRTLDAVLRYRKTLLEAMQAARAGKGKSDFFDRLKSVALEASKEAGKLVIEFESKDGKSDEAEPKKKRADDPIILDVEPIEIPKEGP